MCRVYYLFIFFFLMILPPPRSTLFPYTTLFRSQVEEYFVETMVPGDTFVFAGEILRYEALVEDEVYVSRSEEHTSELQSQSNLVCRLLLEKKKKKKKNIYRKNKTKIIEYKE